MPKRVVAEIFVAKNERRRKPWRRRYAIEHLKTEIQQLAPDRALSGCRSDQGTRRVQDFCSAAR